MINSSNKVPMTYFMQCKTEVLKKVSIPMYFYNIIVPQLGDYYSLYPVDFDIKQVVCCPLHDENTPSCRYYPETNTFYCFGCQKGGNVIYLHKYFVERMNGNSITVDNAVMFLYNYFIKGKEALPVIEQESQQIGGAVKKSSDIEFIRYNRYAETLNSSLLVDKSIGDNIKAQIWKELDLMHLLLAKNEIGATDALNYIKYKVKKVIK